MHDLVVVSDLHLGRGKNPETGRYYELEAFFYDDDFRCFCEWLCEDAARRGTTVRLILNGDTFDLLRLDPVPLPDDRTHRRTPYAPVLTPVRAAAEVGRILEGHPRFVTALATVLARGHSIVVLPGNHDIEIQWSQVQDVMREVLEDSPVFAGVDPAPALARLTFAPWFHYEPGRVWIEHGCQYDPENAFRFPLRRGLVDLPDALIEAELDNPLGNFFQRYLYNAFGHITFSVPSTRANVRYMKWLTVNHPQLLVRIVKSHWRFWWQVLRRVMKYPSRARDRLAETHARELNELMAASGLGKKLETIDSMKETHTDLFQAIRGFGWQALKFLLAIALVGSLVLGLWFAGYHAINQVKIGLLAKGTLFMVFGFLFLLSAFTAVLYTLMRGTAAVPPEPMRRAAAEIAKLLDVPIVSFGHSHDEVLFRNDTGSKEPSWYFNTGTWIAVFTHDVLLPRERVQFTFLRVLGHEGELLHWSPGRREPVPVILLDEPHPGRSSATARMDAPS
jgi:UDP-2,3-diacylglucosamine pyrophosphatase LpxH